MFDQCWAIVVDGGPTLVKHWVDVSRLLRRSREKIIMRLILISIISSVFRPCHVAHHNRMACNWRTGGNTKISRY